MNNSNECDITPIFMQQGMNIFTESGVKVLLIFFPLDEANVSQFFESLVHVHI